MRLGLIADVHGNALATAACFRHMDALKVDQCYFLGDAVGYLPGDQEALSLLETRGVICQMGNHEAMLMRPDARAVNNEAVYHLAAAKARLGAEALQHIASWPEQREVAVKGRRLLLVHGSPAAPLDGYVYEDGDLTPYENVSCDAVFMAHTHRPFIRERRGRLFVNVGSVGLPRDRGDLGALTVYDGTRHKCTIYRFRFEVDAVMKIYGQDINASVAECLWRRSDDVFGEILNG